MRLQSVILVLAVIVMMFAVSSACTMHLAYAEEIPNSIKNKISSWVSNQRADDFSDAMTSLSNLEILKAKITSKQNIYSLPSYGETTFIKISGKTGEHGEAKYVTLVVVDPDGTKSEYTIPVLESGTYYTMIPLTHNSPKGTYIITAQYEEKRLPESYFYVEYPNAIVPTWVTSVAKWWLEEKITDEDFLAGINYLINNKIIRFGAGDTVQESVLNVSVDGQKAVRRGTTQNISVHVTDAGSPVDGATVFVRVEDYGEDVFEEFNGFTDSRGEYSVSWEISEDFPNLKTLLVYVDVTDGLSSITKVFTFEVYCLCGEPNCKCRT
ncbi:carboxypeptidase-like regulatory domain-containing protein [Candidatus Nitrosotenuis sp. DW1]|uniref:carboxypeptidase-like regulatory domain-containing protein n=1 Tax=Candidatus Nitrosotenuis sp. DW1 TaxID=2259672 RepID=UPI0015CCA881|nr:carboxypeptidase-like regulatory domain-containing protein [Candidatus Nitrosotenuis sp. DW1]